jgi:hypothetical protein
LEEVLEKNKILEKEVAELRQQVFNLMQNTIASDKKKIKQVETENKKLRKRKTSETK